MTEDAKRKGLGRGLSALLGDAPDVSAMVGGGARRPERMAAVDLIRPNPDQPRKSFEKSELEDLAASISEKGVIQPIIVRPDPDRAGGFQIVAGERRWRAAQIARLHEMPVIERELSDAEVLELGVIENVQRADLNPVEEAEGYAQLIERFGHTQEALARIVGKSRSYIANALRLRTLPGDVLGHLSAGRISSGHARALITADNPSGLARQVIDRGLTVRDVERLVKRRRDGGSAPRGRAPGKDADTIALEADLKAALGLPVSIAPRPDGRSGEVRIVYRTLDDLDGLCRLLSQSR